MTGTSCPHDVPVFDDHLVPELTQTRGNDKPHGHRPVPAAGAAEPEGKIAFPLAPVPRKQVRKKVQKAFQKILRGRPGDNIVADALILTRSGA